ncbi:hypothetical protein DQ384_36435 [Sphaerisporangium album]|uniref:Uncharacterized protein n=1 Tax=Sphaerisporangium album TaxID=509200 RepID=A0A367EXQ6_9ACTN|nr:hypothetical protein [Sphaerisporangium album]RCG21950.1 hypothetical protein DQ384_36435 [Sphaerisporangium album]
MSDRSLHNDREQAKRGKSSRPKHPHEAGRAVFDHDGNLVAVLRGRDLTDADVDQARALVAWMPDYTTAIGGGHG